MASMRRCFSISLAVACALWASACQVDLERISEVTKLRLLGAQADPPEIAPGGATTLRLLTADPNGAGRRVVAGGVVVPGLVTPIESGDPDAVPPIFFDLPFTDANHLGVVTFTGQLSMPEYYLDGDAHIPIAPPGDPLTMTAIVIVCAGDGFDETLAYEALAGLMDEESGSAAEISFESVCKDAGADEGIAAFKTFDVVTCDPSSSSLSCDGEYAPNANPEIASLTLEDEPLGSFEGGVCIECGSADGCREPLKLRAFLDESSFQEYERPLAINLDETELVYERTYISWFATGGSFDADRSGNASTATEPRADDPFETQWTPSPEGGEFTLWAVVHDLRGGVSWETFTVNAGGAQ
jgi:hypothetical protein